MSSDDEHPEDRLARLQAEAKARKNVDKFCQARLPELFNMIATYSDADAEFLLESLREEFWISDWAES